MARGCPHADRADEQARGKSKNPPDTTLFLIFFFLSNVLC